MDQLDHIAAVVVEGKASLIKTLVEKALEEGIPPLTILYQGLIKGMNIVSQRFYKEEFYIPDVLLSSRAVHAGIWAVKPFLLAANVQTLGKVVIGTVAGDLHDIGKNLVVILLRANGYEVVDLGIDIHPEEFVEAVIKHRPQIVGMSALLTTTMPVMDATIKMLEQAGLRKDVQVIIGGAPITGEYMKTIKADGYAKDGISAVELVDNCLKELNRKN